jgi:type IV pilus assembly protein PilM
MFSLLRRNRSTVGLDLGSGTLKVAAIDHAGARPEVTYLAAVPTPPGAVADGAIAEPERVADALRDLFSAMEVKPRRLAISVGGRDLVVKRIRLDRMEPEYLADAVRWEAEQHMPFEIGDVVMDYQVLDPAGEGPQMDVLLAGARREAVEHRLALLRSAGLAASIVDADPLALRNAFLHNYPDAERSTLALVEVGHRVSTAIVLDDGVPTLTRELPFGTGRVRDRLRSEFALSDEEAERVVQGRSARERDLQAVLDETAGELATGIERTLSFHAIHAADRAIGRVCLCGGGMRLPRLVSQVATRLRVRTEVVNPLQQLRMRPGAAPGFPVDELAPMMMLPVGLALRAAA